MKHTIEFSVLDILNMFGELTPHGETNIDCQRLDNLEKAGYLVLDLISQIKEASEYAERREHSMSNIGCQAVAILEDINNILNMEE